MTATTLLLFGNVSQPPYCNNLFPPLRALQRVFRTTVVEPQKFPGFVSTGGAKPALVPDAAVIENTDPPPDVVVCLGGALHFSEPSRRILRNRPETVLAGFALSDPYGLPASVRIAPQFDLFYTQDAQTAGDYAAAGVAVKRCDPSTDADLYRPLRAAPEHDVLYYGKWTPQRDALVSALAGRFSVRVHAYAGETRWSVPAGPPLDTPEALCAAINRSRLALETSRLDDAEGKYRDAFHLTPRAFFAASCGVPTLVEGFPGLAEHFVPGEEIADFPDPAGALETAARLLADERARLQMGRRARQRAMRDHTWERRVESFLMDIRQFRSRPRSRVTR